MDKLNFFIDNKFDSHEELIDFYLKHFCRELMFQEPDHIIAVKNKILQSIVDYAKTNSKIYRQNLDYYTRNQLDNKNLWICENIDNKNRILNQNTSGSTTGVPFNYLSDKKYFDKLQRLSEFELILNEYNLFGKSLKILNLFKHPYNPKPKEFILETNNHSNRKFHSYGAKEFSTFFVNWDNYIDKPDEWHDNFLMFLSNHVFDIVLCSGPVINILNRYIKKKSFVHRFAYLLSHTTEFPRIDDFQYLKDNGNINYYCDHMRCWDGGASFFTCKHGTYHLNDNLSWVVQGPDNKMISTDYFNIVTPFVNYWNGDLCEIKDQYKLCECGRYYRPFKMLENRPFALKGPTKLTEIREQIKRLSFKNQINQIQFDNLTVNVYNDSELSTEQKNILNNILSDYKVKYYE